VVRAAFQAARTIGHCIGSRAYAIVLKSVLRERRASSAIFTVPGKTSTGSAALLRHARE